MRKGRLIKKGAATLSGLSKTAGMKYEPFFPMLVGTAATTWVLEIPWTLLKRWV